MTTLELTGTWSGHYEQNGRGHGISMRVVQRGQSFVGEMRDADTVLASRETLPARPMGPGGGLEVVGEADVLSTLPEVSIVEGEVTGRVVVFAKQYQGKSTVSILMRNRKAMTFEAPGHRVLYRGILAASGVEISGTWSIAAGETGPSQRGRFVLRRSPPPGATEQ
jgi:hypothetical protein